MDPLSRNVAQSLVDQALADHPALPLKYRAFDRDCEMGFATAIVTRMAVVGGAVVDNGKAGRRESGGQQHFHFGLQGRYCHRTVFSYLCHFAKEKA